MSTNAELLHTAQRAAHRAAEHIRSAIHPGRVADWEVKGVSDFVTHVDRDAERIIADTVLAAYPESVVLGEELTPDDRAGHLVWVVDPLDGTTNFLHAFPAFAVSIAALVDGMLAAAVVVDVPRDHTYHATAGGGAWRGETRLHVSEIREPRHALVGTGFPFKAMDRLPQYLRHFTTILRATSGVRRAGSAALDLVSAASGVFDGFWELSLAPWDVAAGTLIVREAGGLVTDLAGNRDVIRQGSIVAGNPAIHGWLLEALAD